MFCPQMVTWDLRNLLETSSPDPRGLRLTTFPLHCSRLQRQNTRGISTDTRPNFQRLQPATCSTRMEETTHTLNRPSSFRLRHLPTERLQMAHSRPPRHRPLLMEIRVQGRSLPLIIQRPRQHPVALSSQWLDSCRGSLRMGIKMDRQSRLSLSSIISLNSLTCTTTTRCNTSRPWHDKLRTSIPVKWVQASIQCTSSREHQKSNRNTKTRSTGTDSIIVASFAAK